MRSDGAHDSCFRHFCVGPRITYRGRSSKAKVLAASGDGFEELAPQHVIAVVLGEIQLVKACVRTRKAIFVAIITMDVETIDTVHAFQFLESVEGNFTGSGDKL